MRTTMTLSISPLRRIAAMVCLVAMINAANRLGVIVRQKGGSYEAGMFDSMLS